MTTPQSLIELCARTVEALRVNGGQEWGEGHLIAVRALTEASAAIRALSVDATADGRKCACDFLGRAGVACNGWKGGCACCTPPVCKQCGHSEVCHSSPAEPMVSTSLECAERVDSILRHVLPTMVTLDASHAQSVLDFRAAIASAKSPEGK